MKTVVTDYTFLDLSKERAVATAHGASFEAHQCRSEADVVDAVKGADGVFLQFAPMTERALSVLAPGACVVRYGVGYDNIDVEAARRLGISLAYVPDYCRDEVADHASAMTLSMLRRLPMLDASIRNGNWSAVQVSQPLKPFSVVIFGFFGFGRIGQAVMARLTPFGFKFLVCDPCLTESLAKERGVTPTNKETLLREADVISFHLPVTSETRHMLNDDAIAEMKDTAIIINTSRGELIDEVALAKALMDRKLGGAALDVFESEPLGKASPLRQAPNCLLTPHAGWYSDMAIEKLQSLASEELARHFKGENLRCPIP